MGLFSRLAAFWHDLTDTMAPWDDYPTESDPPPEHRPPPSIGDYDPYQAALFAATATPSADNASSYAVSDSGSSASSD